MVKWYSALLIRCLLLFVTCSCFAANPVAGVDYTPVNSSLEFTGKVRVVEFFAFNCIHCAEMEHFIKQSLYVDNTIDLTTIHVAWNSNMQELARLNATINYLGWHYLMQDIFNAVNTQHLDLSDLNNLRKLFTNLKVTDNNIDKFFSIYNSRLISDLLVEQNKALTNITAVPLFIVIGKCGKYQVVPSTPERTMSTVKYLISKLSKDSQHGC